LRSIVVPSIDTA